MKCTGKQVRTKGFGHLRSRPNFRTEQKEQLLLPSSRRRRTCRAAGHPRTHAHYPRMVFGLPRPPAISRLTAPNRPPTVETMHTVDLVRSMRSSPSTNLSTSTQTVAEQRSSNPPPSFLPFFVVRRLRHLHGEAADLRHPRVQLAGRHKRKDDGRDLGDGGHARRPVCLALTVPLTEKLNQGVTISVTKRQLRPGASWRWF